MASQTLQLFMAYLDSKDFKAEIMDEEESVVRSGMTLDNTRIEYMVNFGEEGHDVAIRGFGFVKVPEGKKDVVYELCNTCNRQFRWVKFYYDEERDMLFCEDDALIQLDSCAEETFELMMRMAHVVDNAYPVFMKGFFA